MVLYFRRVIKERKKNVAICGPQSLQYLLFGSPVFIIWRKFADPCTRQIVEDILPEHTWKIKMSVEEELTVEIRIGFFIYGKNAAVSTCHLFTKLFHFSLPETQDSNIFQILLQLA